MNYHLNFDDNDGETDLGVDDHESGTSGLTRRERNREAVRNCRKRKREQADKLHDRIAKLTLQNKQLHELLSTNKNYIATKGAGRQATLLTFDIEEKQIHDKLVGNIASALRAMDEQFNISKFNENSGHFNANNSAFHEAQNELKGLTESYSKHFVENSALNRSKVGFVFRTVFKMLETCPQTKAFLMLGILFDGMKDYEISTNNIDDGQRMLLQEELRTYLKLTTEQETQLASRSTFSKWLITEGEYTVQKAGKIHNRLADMKPSANALLTLNTILTAAQTARFLVWAEKDPSREFFNHLWDGLMRDYDEEIAREKFNIVRSNRRTTMIAHMRGAFQFLSARALGESFTRSVEWRTVALNRIFHPNISLVDFNNALTDVCTREKAIKGVNVVLSNFDQSKMCLGGKLNDFVNDMEAGKITMTWELSGFYTGRLLGNTRRTHSSSVSTASGDTGTGDENGHSTEIIGKQVSIQILCDTTFGDMERPELITELVVNWDVLGLLKQLKSMKRTVEAGPDT